jgi:hypothetical protein
LSLLTAMLIWIDRGFGLMELQSRKVGGIMPNNPRDQADAAQPPFAWRSSL